MAAKVGDGHGAVVVSVVALRAAGRRGRDVVVGRGAVGGRGVEGDGGGYGAGGWGLPGVDDEVGGFCRRSHFVFVIGFEPSMPTRGGIAGLNRVGRLI